MTKNTNELITAQQELADAIINKDKNAAVIAQLTLLKRFGCELDDDLKDEIKAL